MIEERIMKRWCLLAHSDCKDGYTKESECQCVFWDCFYKSCVQAAWMFMAHDKMSGQEMVLTDTTVPREYQ